MGDRERDKMGEVVRRGRQRMIVQEREEENMNI